MEENFSASNCQSLHKRHKVNGTRRPRNGAPAFGKQRTPAELRWIRSLPGRQRLRPVSENDAICSVCEAIHIGINFFDTSPYYGGTLLEKMLGKTLKALGVARNEYIVSTKCGRYMEGFDFSAERVTRSIDESLARLQLDYVDILQCHDIE